MAEHQNKDEPASEHRVISGATGGPATATGVGYQVDYAIIRTLMLLDGYFSASAIPKFSPFIKIEPRIEDGNRLVRWDIQILSAATQQEAIEAKSNLSNPDVLEFCRRVAEHSVPNANQTFHLTYGDGSPSNLTALEALARMAREADDHRAFQVRLRRERPKGDPQIFDALGDKAYHRLRAIKPEPHPHQAIKRDIRSMSGHMAGPSQAAALANFLFRRLHEAMQNRESILLKTLISEIATEGITLKPLQEDDLGHVSDDVRFLVDAIRHCPNPIPVAVAAIAAGLSTEKLLSQLDPYFQSEGLSNTDGMIEASLTARKLAPPKLNPQASNVITALLEHIKINKNSSVCLHQAENVIALFRLLESPSGTLTLDVFERLDKPLKRFATKKQVLVFANLCIEKARLVQSESHEEMKNAAKAVAKALICGVSWVAQRVGNLRQAALSGTQSLEMGKKIPWPRNTAFCLKCLGRLKRLEAEGFKKGRRQNELLNASTKSFLEAIELFEEGFGNGPLTSEVGDCWSLLGRTYLVHEKLPEATDALNNAAQYLTDEGDKDYLDWLILVGDLAMRRVAYPKAEQHYQRVIDSVDHTDVERSEICARAWLQLGVCRSKSGRGDWRAAIETAITIWTSIDEQHMAAVAKCRLMEISNEVSDKLLDSVSKYEPQTRVELLHLLNEKLAQQAASGILANRIEVPDGVIQEIAKEAESNVQIATRSWTFNG